ncbi:MAG TPA: hypothetical protein VKG84_07130 [Candidatus Acidoferrales bacterium]|nr:hypothetical protein [Candidatus Acidoferrales bacterium]
MTDTSKPAAAPSTTSNSAGATAAKSSPGIHLGFLLEFIGAAAVVGAAFFSPLPERIAVLAGVSSFAIGRFFPRIVK